MILCTEKSENFIDLSVGREMYCSRNIHTFPLAFLLTPSSSQSLQMTCIAGEISSPERV